MILGTIELQQALERMSIAQIHQAASQGIKLVQAEAKLRCPKHDGELKDSIYTKTEWTPDHVTATCYTNKKYAEYVEHGTGPKGEKNHEGISPYASPVYVQSPWWIHESMIDPGTAEKYHWFCIDTPEGKFYQCVGQAAQPFMYPALKSQEDEVMKIFSEYVRRQL